MTAGKPFSAVLLAGGSSTRMGRDKAGMILEGVPLWRRQLATLRETAPAELFISARSADAFPESECQLIIDEQPGLGPLAGVAAGLRHSHHEHVLFLAIDLPRIPSQFLTELLRAAARADHGIVPRCGEGFEPLAAVYPRRSLKLVHAQLQTEDRSMQRFVRAAIAAKMVGEYLLDDETTAYFLNLNTEADRRAASHDLPFGN